MKMVTLAAMSLMAIDAMAAGYDLAAFVWPAYHNEPRWAELGIFADGKGEWQNLYESTKRTPDDYQGVKPLWDTRMNPIQSPSLARSTLRRRRA